MPTEVPIESRDEVWSDLSIDSTDDVPVEWSNEMQDEWWGELQIELRVELPIGVPIDLPIGLPSAKFSSRLGCESWCERAGACGADACWKCCWLSGLKLRCKRIQVTSCESGRIRESADRCRCFCR